MSDYISREAALKAAEHAYGEWNLAMAAADGARQINLVYKRQELLKAVASVFDIVPAADVEPVRHGQWVRIDDDWNSLTTFQCTVCGEEFCFEIDEDIELLNYNYCPNCGAKMELEDDHENFSKQA